MKKTQIKMLLSVAAVALGMGAVPVASSHANDAPLAGIILGPGEVSSAPEIQSGILPPPSAPLAHPSDEIPAFEVVTDSADIEATLAQLTPASGAPVAGQVTGGALVATDTQPLTDTAAPPSPQVLSAPAVDPVIPPGAAPVAPIAPAVAELPPSTPTPDEALAAPGIAPMPGMEGTPAAPVLPGADSGTNTTNTIAKPADVGGVDDYYDSNMNMPTGEMANKIGPRKVDPTKEPASKLIIVRKTHNESDQESLIEAANRALESGSNEAALELFSELYARNKRDQRILMGRAIAQQRMGMDDVAMASYEELLDRAPNNTEAVINLMGLMRKQYPEVAIRRLNEIKNKYPNNDMVIGQLGMVYAQSGRYDDANRNLQIAASLNPRNALHYYNLGILADRMGNKAQAVRFYESALQADQAYGNSKSIPRETIQTRLNKLRQ